ncbi:peptidoglycan bridge formation glycyltransferase FemA/FemB family protein [Pseudodesulfovibrio thermohalotolerans]|uniref:lipid II:glycine glycyltransferase FemX n=1 Tax=Pseudodesulfovibrio thermohalotolerans TaxID=2880651 RepID=UPI0024436BCD|nr:peptidoglycan bridge formation glycyltransferase FemA/FemB family protein [Pseudodesulfovibrio thermohalotolerans]WFS61584.1 peptidoglycan bridge formation glycyltransferase FemA/FemB family protein [Pseudodesulfovibrio thermohalotolerans]
MDIVIATEKDRADWNDFLARCPNGNLRQTFAWGRIKAKAGWEPIPLMAKAGGEVRAAMLILKKRLPLGFSLLYACRGPVLAWDDVEAVQALFEWVRRNAGSHKAVMLRIDPEPGDEALMARRLADVGFIELDVPYTGWNRTRYEIRLALKPEETIDDLFRSFRRTHRQNIASAGKKGVTLEIGYKDGDDRIFFDLMQQLESNKHALYHSFEYYSGTIAELLADGSGEILKAVYDGKVIGVLILNLVGDRCWAVYQANDYDYRKLMPNKFVLWEGIKYAKEKGCVFFDMGATQGRAFNPDSALDGYKMAYRPDVVAFPPYYDLPLNRLLYRCFSLMEFKLIPRLYDLRRKWENMKKKFGS